MSLADNLIRTIFTVVAVALSYSFEPDLAGSLSKAQPHISAFAVNVEAAAIIVVPTFVIATLTIRAVRNARADNA